MGMTNQEAIETIEANYPPENYSMLREALGIAIALLKKQEAKRPVVREKNGYWDHVCPTCGSLDEELGYEWNYCPFCGQAVNWE